MDSRWSGNMETWHTYKRTFTTINLGFRSIFIFFKFKVPPGSEMMNETIPRSLSTHLALKREILKVFEGNFKNTNANDVGDLLF